MPGINSHYKPMRTPPISAWARHIDAYFRQEDLSVAAGHRKLRKALGLGPNSRSAFRDYLIDKPLSPEHAEALAAIIGWPPAEPPMEEPEPSVDVPGLVAAMMGALLAQTQALTDIRLALADARKSAEEQREATAGLIGHLSDQLDELRELVRTGAGSAGQDQDPAE